MSLNNIAAFGEVENTLYAASCQNGLGTIKGTLHVMAAADLAMGKYNKLLRQLKKTANPILLPPEPIAKIGTTSRLLWREWLAGKEL